MPPKTEERERERSEERERGNSNREKGGKGWWEVVEFDWMGWCLWDTATYEKVFISYIMHISSVCFLIEKNNQSLIIF